MRVLMFGLVMCGLVLSGCAESAPKMDPSVSSRPGGSGDGGGDSGEGGGGSTGESKASTENPMKSRDISPSTTTIAFVGKHVEASKPDDRFGKFQVFSGKCASASFKMKELELEIDTASLMIEPEPSKLDAEGAKKLEEHLMNADFFNVSEFPKATFKATSIEYSNSENAKITGDLTLLGETKEITFDAMIRDGNGFMFEADFVIDRTAFGMDWGLDDVQKEVQLKISMR